MAKRDDVLRNFGNNISESMGVDAGRPPSMAKGASRPNRLKGAERRRDVLDIAVDRIEPDPDQPREEFDEESLGRLAESLRTRGQLQPIRVRWSEARDSYVILVGERRWRAAKMAGMAAVAAVVHDGELTPGQVLSLQLIENALREDLRPIERARAYRHLMDENGWSGSQLARELAVSQPSVVESLRLLSLPEVVREKVEQGALAPTVAYEVSKLDDPAEQAAVAEWVVASGLSHRQAKDLVRERKGRPSPRRFEFQVSGSRVTLTVMPPVEDIRSLLLDILAQLDARRAG